MTVNKRSWVYFPLAFLLFATIGIFICYALAIANDHVVDTPMWPFVSDLGGTPPEGCIFTLLFNWAAMALLLLCFGFYKFVRDHGHKTKLNKASLIFGIIAAAGVSIVGCFRWNEVISVHLVGAAMAFGGGIVYCWILVAISWRYFRLKVYTNLLVCLRVVLVSLQTISLVMFIVFFITSDMMSVLQRGGQIYRDGEPLKRAAECTAMEWLLMFSQLIYYASIAYDFNHIKGFKFSIKHVEGEQSTRVQPQDANDIIQTSVSTSQERCDP